MPEPTCLSALHFLHDTENAKWLCHLPAGMFMTTEKMLVGLPQGLDTALCTSWDLKPKSVMLIVTGADVALGDLLTVTKGKWEYTYILTPRGWLGEDDYAKGITEAKKREAERVAKRDAARKLAAERRAAEKMFLLGNVMHLKEKEHA